MIVCLAAYKFYESVPRMFQFASALVERGDSVDVIALRRSGQPAFEIVNGVRIHRVQLRVVDESGPISHIFKMLRFILVAGMVISKNHLVRKYDLIQVFSVPDCLVFAAVLPKLTGASIILDVYDIVPEFYAAKYGISKQSAIFRALLWAERSSMKFSDHVTITNLLWYDRVTARSAPPAKCTTIETVPSSTLFYPRAKHRIDDLFIIIYPGTLNRHQGVDIAVRAFARISNDIPKAQFHIYGEGPSRCSLIKLVKDLELEERILFWDLLPTESIVRIMADADLAIVPKRASSDFGNEASSTKIGEFMSLGVPIIVSKTKIECHYYTCDQVKFFESEDEADLADSIKLLYGDAILRSQFVNNAAKYMQENNWEVKKERYLQVIDLLAVKHSPITPAT